MQATKEEEPKAGRNAVMTPGREAEVVAKRCGVLGRY
jgi:hypothetical protein